MYIAVCDDQMEELSALESLLQNWQEQRKHALHYKIFRNATELLNTAYKEQFTLYLMDIMMPGIDGMAAAREIRDFDNTADIIFLTSSPGFAYESYGVHALDYLLKPIQAERLFPILDKLAAREQHAEDSLTLKCSSSLVRIPFSQLSHVEVIGRHLYFNLTDGSVREVYGQLKEYEPLLLAHPEFMRVHRSFIVNMLQVAELSPTEIHTFSGKCLPVSRTLHPQLQKDYRKLLFARRGG